MSRRALAVLLLLALPASAQQTPPPPEPPGKALVRRYIADVLAGGRLDLLETYVTADYADRTPGADSDLAGPALVRRSQERLRALFPEVRYTVDQLLAEGDLVVARYVVQALHRPPGDAPPREVAVSGMTLFRVSDGKIRETWTINDRLGMYRQLGYTLEPPKDEPAAPPAAPAEQ